MQRVNITLVDTPTQFSLFMGGDKYFLGKAPNNGHFLFFLSLVFLEVFPNSLAASIPRTTPSVGCRTKEDQIDCHRREVTRSGRGM